VAYTNIPSDISRVKSKLALNLSKRQLICFGAAALIGIPMYFLTFRVIGNSVAAMLMIGLMLPFFFLAMYEKDGMPAEIVLRNVIRVRFLWPGKRPYVTENLYEIMEKGAKNIATQNKTATKTAGGKRQPSKKQPR
jgi:hypothetical protein